MSEIKKDTLHKDNHNNSLRNQADSIAKGDIVKQQANISEQRNVVNNAGNCSPILQERDEHTNTQAFT